MNKRQRTTTRRNVFVSWVLALLSTKARVAKVLARSRERVRKQRTYAMRLRSEIVLLRSALEHSNEQKALLMRKLEQSSDALSDLLEEREGLERSIRAASARYSTSTPFPASC